MTTMSLFLCIAFMFLSTCYTQSTIPIPTQSQYEYQQREIVALTHFNMGTYYGDSDPSCNKNNWNASGNPVNFKPMDLNISNWVESYKALGAKSAVLTAKHGCGFLLFPTKVILPSGNLYNYSSQFSSSPIKDIIKEFTTTLKANNIGAGFYYSLKNNFYLNVIQFKIQNTILPGQQNVTMQQFENIAIAQLEELFSNYGNLTEFWFDGGTSDMSSRVQTLIQTYQPTMAVYNGQDVSPNAVKWVGTESGMDNKPIWSVGCNSGNGDPNATDICPTGCDTTLQDGGDWFYVNNVGIKSLQTLIEVYHNSVGNNGVLELDFAIDNTGNVHPNQATAYKQLGNWIRSCYTNPLNQTKGTINNQNGMLELQIKGEFDRVMIQENLLKGQRIRQFSIMVNNQNIYQSTAVGYKKIALFDKTYASSKVQLVLNEFVGVDGVDVVNFAVFAPCPKQ